jgi:hypothetical protein
MLTNDENAELNGFLNRLQGQFVRVEFSSRINTGFRLSFSTKLDRLTEGFSFTSENGDVSVFIDPNEAEGFASDHSSVSLVYGDDLITIRYARKR